MRSTLKILLLMLTVQKVLGDAVDKEEERLVKKEEESSSFSSSSWNDGDDEVDEILVFENHRSLLNEKNKFKRNSEQGDDLLATKIPRANIGLRGGHIPYMGAGYSPVVPSCWMCSLERNGCQIVSGIFTRPILPYGYSLVTTFPAGVCNITVVEVTPSKNYFALRNKENKYLLNGNWDLQAAGSYELAGTTFDYSPSDGTRGEKLQAIGPLIETIDLMIIYQSKNLGIKYEYRIPVSDLNKGSQRRSFPSGPYQSHMTPSHPQMSRRDSMPLYANSPPGLRKPKAPTSWNPYLSNGSPGGSSSSALRPNLIKSDKSNTNLAPQSSPPSSSNYNRSQKERYAAILSIDSGPTKKEDPVNSFQATSSVRSRRREILNKGYQTSTNYIPPNGNDSLNLHRMRHNHRKIKAGSKLGRKGILLQKNAERRKGNKKSNSRRRKKKGKRKNGKRRKNRYIWTVNGLTECSRSCGGGTRSSLFSCERRRKGIFVADKFCQDLTLPKTKSLSCNANPCPANWVADEEWSPCSVTCGKGFQSREVHCKQEVSPTLTMMVAEETCFTENPFNTSQECSRDACPPLEPHWKANEWSKCSIECGTGVRTREIRCHHKGSVVEESLCDEQGAIKQTIEEPCDMGTCVKENTWFFSSWSQKCTDDCENGINSRTVVCIQSEFDFDDSCPITTRPEPAKPCQKKPNCVGQWFTGPWSSCSVSCGVGFETRITKCLTMKEGGQWLVGDEAACPSALRPLDSRECFQIPCGSKWFTSKWSECSTTCNIGVQRREIRCLDSHLEQSALCPNDTKATAARDCNRDRPCLVYNPEGSTRDNTLYPNKTTGSAVVLDKSPTKDGNRRNHKISKYDNSSIDTDNNEQSNELTTVTKFDNQINVIPDKDAQGDQSISPIRNRRPRKGSRRRKIIPGPSLGKGSYSCVDRIKNCQLVFRARLCRLKFYNKLCCATCRSQ